MLSKKRYVLTAALVIGSMLLAACAAPAPEQVEVVVTKIVTEAGETVVETETIVVTATPVPPTPVPPKVDLDGLWFPLGTEPPLIPPRT